MILRSPQPLTDDSRMPFGKHYGERMEDVSLLPSSDSFIMMMVDVVNTVRTRIANCWFVVIQRIMAQSLPEACSSETPMSQRLVK